MIFSKLSIISCCLLGLAQLPALQTDAIRLSSYEDFTAGELEQLEVSSIGEVQLGHAIKQLAEFPAENIFEAVRAADGTLYFGTGNEGSVYRLKPGGEAEVYFTSDSVIVHALALGPEGALYAGTSPNGAVYRMVEGERPQIYFDPEDIYIWDLLFEEDGTLYVATGNEAVVYKLKPDFQPGDEATIWYTSDRRRILDLEFDPQGDLLAAASSDSLIYKITAQDTATVLFYAGTDEISDLYAAPDGSIYFATLHQGNLPGNLSKATPADLPELMEKMAQSATEGSKGNSGPPESNGGNSGNGKPSPAGAPSFLYRIGPDGFGEPIWSPGGHNIFSFHPMQSGTFWVGTNDAARLYKAHTLADWSLVASPETGGTLSCLLEDDAGGLYLLTSNPAAVYHLPKQSAETGTLTTEALDAGAVAHWGRLRPIANTAGPLDGVTWEARAGNAPQPDASWAEWATVEDLSLAVPNARYLQLRATFTDEAAVLRALSAFYLLDNGAPVVNRINILPVGLEVITLAAPNKGAINLKTLTSEKPLPNELPDGPMLRSQVRVTGDVGQYSFGWNAFDPNGDTLEFSIALRQEGTEAWALLASELDEPVYSLDTRGLADGYYRAKVTASDRPANPPGRARSGTLVSGLFLIDNTPPSIDISSLRVEDNTAHVTLEATDALSIITRAHYTLDGKAPRAAFPKDFLFDANAETFHLQLEDLSPGEHTLVFEVSDEVGNRAKAQRVFTLPESP